MQQTRTLWRGLFFILLITAVCGGLVLPVLSLPVHAAPLPANPLDVVINEIAWGGTTASASAEWIELYNTTTSDIDLTNWTIVTGDGNPTTITIPSGIIPKDGYFLLERVDTAINDIPANYVYGGANFSNSGESLQLYDSFNNPIDSANGNGGAWPAGTAATGTPAYGSMERINYLIADSDSNWQTNNGTVRNGSDSATPPNPINGTPKQINSATPLVLATTATQAANLTASVVNMTNTSVAATASVVNITNTAVAANATSTAAVVNATSTAAANLTNTAAAITPSAGPARTVLINEVAWSGTSSTTTNDEWIELYNPSATKIDLTGWKLRSSDGTPDIDLSSYSIDPSDYLVLARNAGTFQPPLSYSVESSISLSNSGEILSLVDSANRVIDTANSDGGSWPAGTSSTGTLTYASMERIGTTASQWITYAGTVPIAYNRNGDAVHGTPGRSNWISTTTITTITSDSPDPSLVNQNVTVSVTVIGGMTIPTGTITISGTNSNCTIKLTTASAGKGSCTVRFTSTGFKTIIATYGGDSSHPASTDTESHQVSTTIVRTPTRAPTALPPPPLLAINEFVPRPGHDWNNDGVINTNDEYIEILNHGVVDVSLSGYSLDDEVNVGSTPFRLPAITLKPGERHVFYGSETGLLLGDGGDGVRLLKPNGQLMDAYNYTVVRFPDQSYCRLPDNGGADDWNQNCFPTPGLQNSLSGSTVDSPTSGGAENLCPIADTLPPEFVLAECPPFGNGIWNPAYWDQSGWYDEKNLQNSPGKWPLYAE